MIDSLHRHMNIKQKAKTSFAFQVDRDVTKIETRR